MPGVEMELVPGIGGLAEILPKSVLRPSCIAYRILYLPPFCGQHGSSNTYYEFVHVSKEAELCHKLLTEIVLSSKLNTCIIYMSEKTFKTKAFFKKAFLKSLRIYKGIINASLYLH